MASARETIEILDGLVREFGLTEATLRRGEAEVTLRKVRAVATVTTVAAPGEAPAMAEAEPEIEEAAPVETPKGTPVTSPMNGIYYASPSPGTPPFVKEGDTVTAGQPIGIVEAMKVFNEIPCPVSGTVLKVVAKPGAVVAPGETLLLVG